MFGSQSVVHDQRPATGDSGDLTCDSLVGIDTADNPAATMKIEEHTVFIRSWWVKPGGWYAIDRYVFTFAGKLREVHGWYNAIYEEPLIADRIDGSQAYQSV
jgi:hypothetical protein